jgi:hypothetical protein
MCARYKRFSLLAKKGSCIAHDRAGTLARPLQPLPRTWSQGSAPMEQVQGCAWNTGDTLVVLAVIGLLSLLLGYQMSRHAPALLATGLQQASDLINAAERAFALLRRA